MFAVALALLFLPGCAQLTRIEDKVDDVSTTSHGLERQQSATAEQVDGIKKSLESEGITSDEKRADLLSRFKDMERSVQQLEARVEDQGNLLTHIQASLDLLVAGENPNPRTRAAQDESYGTEPDSSATTGGSTTPPADRAAPPPASDAGAGESAVDSMSSTQGVSSRSPGVEVYDAAFRDFTKGSYSLAREGFKEFLARYPDSDLSDNASYWIGETWYTQGNYQEAVRHFDAVLRTYPEGDIIPGALLKSSNCHLELGEKDRALEGYRRLIREYPNSDEAFIAQHKLTDAGVATKP
jgi:tol-pal system protein YbgF